MTALPVCSKREEEIAAGNAEIASASAAASVQDDFADLGEGDLAELDIKDRPENQARHQLASTAAASRLPGLCCSTG